MADFYKMVLRLEAENDRLHKQLDQSTRKINKFEKSSGSALKSIKSQFAKLGPALAGAVTVGGLAALTSKSLDAADNIQKLGIRLGVSTEALSQYQHVANLTGVSFNQLTTAWQRMTRRIAEAAQDTGEARGALAELGLEAARLSQLAPDRQFEILADAIAKVESPADRVRIAMKLFDSGGVALLQTMQGGSEAIIRMREEADSLGLTLSQDTADAAARANDAMAKFGAATDALGLVLVDALAPAIADIVNWLQNELPSAVQVGSNAFTYFRAEALETASGAATVLSKLFDFLATPVIGESNDAVTQWLRDTSQDLTDVATNAERAAEKVNAMIGATETQKTALETGVTFNELFNANLAATAVNDPTGKHAKSKRSQIDKAKSEADQLTESLRTPFEKAADELDRYDALLAQNLITQDTWAKATNNALDSVFENADNALGKLQSEADELTERMRTPWERTADEIDRYDELLEQNLITQDTWARATNQAIDSVADSTKKITESAEESNDVARELGFTFSSAFEDAIVNGASLKDVLEGLEQDIIRILSRKLVTEPLAEAVTGLFGGLGSGGSSSGGGGGFSGLITSFFGLFGGGKAAGGPVAAGVPYMVGERGPELFVPPVRGNIIPNGRSVGGNTINVTVNNQGAGSSGLSPSQIAVRTGAAVDRAMRRHT